MEKRTYRIIIGETAVATLAEIYKYTADKFGWQQADRYEDFIVNGIESLAEFPDQGRPVAGHPTLAKLTFTWKTSRNGHVAIYEKNDAAMTIEVLQIYHTSMDHQARLDAERKISGDD